MIFNLNLVGLLCKDWYLHDIFHPTGMEFFEAIPILLAIGLIFFNYRRMRLKFF